MAVAIAAAAATKPPKVAPTVVRAKGVTAAPAMPKAVNLVKAKKPAQNVLRAMRQTVRNVLSVQSVQSAMTHRALTAKPQAVVAGVAVAGVSVHQVSVSVPTWMPKPSLPKAL